MSKTQEALDLEYENGAFIPGADAYRAAWPRDAAAFRAKVSGELELSYGDHPREAYDLFLPDGAPKGLMIFIHGGYWHLLAKSDWSHLASGGLARGWAVAMIGYPLAPEWRLSEITRSVAAGIAAAAERVNGPIAITGHSAGGHLTARMCMPGILTDAVAARVTRAVPISPLSDLRPFLKLTMNEALRLDAAEAAAESPVLGSKRDHITLTTVVGADERPAFLDQARWLTEAWGGDQIIFPGMHHFSVVEGLQPPESPLMRAVLGDH